MGEGMGLGFFIAKTFLERTGASLSVTNNIAPFEGAEVRVQWPRGEIEED
jgi:two-component system sensor histidine kinase RegB